MYDTVIEGGLLVTASNAVPADVAISGERIAAVGLGLGGERAIDATGCYVIPGGVDVHVHLQMWVGKYRSSDTFASGTVAAALGGTTTVVDFVEPRDGQSMVAALAERREQADGEVAIDYGLHMTVPAWHADHALPEVPEVMGTGIHSFKLYQAYGRLRLDDARLFGVLETLGDHGALPIVHSENGPVIDVLRERALGSGHTEPIWHARTRPAKLEGQAVAGAVRLAEVAGSSIYIVHVSCGEALQVVAAARRRGQAVFAETCPQYLYLTEEVLAGENGARFICAPPLRTDADRLALWRALGRGDLQVISTDHCPFTLREKEGEPAFTQIPGGLPSIEARLSLIHDAARRGLLTLNQWVNHCCTQPASIFELPRKGHIAPGYDADLVVFDPKQEVVVSAGRLHEHVDWTPYEGLALRGWPRHVLSRGEQIVQDGEFVGVTGRGRFVPAG
jgi:dihydropyrimidinase